MELMIEEEKNTFYSKVQTKHVGADVIYMEI